MAEVPEAQESVQLVQKESATTGNQTINETATTTQNEEITTATTSTTYTSYFASSSQQMIKDCKPAVNKKADPNVVILHQINEGYEIGHVSLSPFCAKLEAYLKFANINHVIYPTYDVQNAPKGKVPFVEHKGKIFGDSSLIIEYLKLEFGDTLDANLTPRQKAIGTLIQRTLEEHFYFVVLYMRWCHDDKKLKSYVDILFKNAPFIFKLVPNALIKSGISGSLQKQGLGRHAANDIFAFGKQDLDAVEAMMDPNNKFLFGNTPSSYDACLYGFLASLLRGPSFFEDYDLIQFAKSKAVFKQYVDTIQKEFFASSTPTPLLSTK